MKHLLGRLLSAMFILALVLNTVLPVWAEPSVNLGDITLSVELDAPSVIASDKDQEVTMTLRTSKPIKLYHMSMELTIPTTLKEKAVLGGDNGELLIEKNTEYSDNGIFWVDENDSEKEVKTTLVTVKITVPAGTAENDYQVGFENIQLEREEGALNTQAIHTVLKVKAKTDAKDGYTASLSTTEPEPTAGEKAYVNVGVDHATDKTFAAGELVLTYDSDKLSFDENSSRIGTATIKEESGTVTLEDYGADKALGNAVYTLAFTTLQDGTANVTLTSAAFVNKTGAEKSDLIPAATESGTLQLSIQKKKYTVTLPEIFAGNATVTEGENYTFTAVDSQNYTYSGVTATMGGTDAPVTNNNDGTYTVSNVTGNLVISGTRTPKSYTVTFDGNAAGDVTGAASAATYGTEYCFTVPQADGWSYKIEKITINGVEYSGYGVSEEHECKILGSAITGDIVISISKTATKAGVSIIGDGAGNAEGNITADIDGNYTLTLKPEKGYTYTVTATMNGVQVAVAKTGDNTYTIENVTGDIVFTITKTVITDDVTVTDYLGVDGNKIWLICKTTELDANKVPTYDGAAMFWSDKYGAYCYLVIAPTLELSEAKTKISITDGTADTVDYGMDVNKTGKVDTSDAQLVYNIYNAQYSDFTNDMPMEKFLRADVNGDKTVNVSDAAAIITHLLAPGTTTANAA